MSEFIIKRIELLDPYSHDTYEVSFVDRDLKPQTVVLCVKSGNVIFNHIADLIDEVLQIYHNDIDYVGNITAIRQLPNLFMVEAEVNQQ